LPEKGRPKATYVEHARIVDAIRTRDVELAAAAMRVHLTLVAQSIERDIANVLTDATAKVSD
jgi:DNA-binding GntR family transcriptional regulator